MAKTKQQKIEAVEALSKDIADATSVVFANYQGLTVADMDALRANCRENGVRCMATKKTLVKRALADRDIDVDTKAYEGGIATFLGTDEVSAPKVVAEFAKDHEIVTIFGGVLEGAYIDADKVKALSKLPSKEELLAKMVGSMNAPVSGFVNVLAGNLRGLVNVLNGIKDAKA